MEDQVKQEYLHHRRWNIWSSCHKRWALFELTVDKECTAGICFPDKWTQYMTTKQFCLVYTHLSQKLIFPILTMASSQYFSSCFFFQFSQKAITSSHLLRKSPCIQILQSGKSHYSSKRQHPQPEPCLRVVSSNLTTFFSSSPLQTSTSWLSFLSQSWPPFWVSEPLA